MQQIHDFTDEGGLAHMKTNYSRLSVALLLILTLAACNLPKGGGTTPSSDNVITIAALTMQALTQSAQQSHLPSPGSTTRIPSTIIRTPNLLATGTVGPTGSPTPTKSPTRTAGPSATLTLTLHPTNTSAPTNTPIPDPGTITGNISGYPYGSVPGLTIVAFGQEPPYNYSYWITGAGSTYFAMTSEYLTPGHYQVVAYDASGHAGGCTAIALVVSKQTVNCDITNWGGGYPAKPSGVPSP